MKNMMKSNNPERDKKVDDLLARRADLLIESIYSDSMSMARRWQIDTELAMLTKLVRELEEEK